MDVKQTGAMLEMIRLAYPRYKGFSDEENAKQLMLWHKHFEHEDATVVRAILDEYIAHNLYPPSIADIKAGIRNISMPSKEKLWNELLEASRKSVGSTYVPIDKDHSRKVRNREIEFEKLSEPLKQFVGSPSGLEDFKDEMENNALRLKDAFNRRIDSILESCRTEKLRERIEVAKTKRITGGDANGNI